MERKYIIPLRQEWLKVPKYKRAKKAVTGVRQFLQKHMKVEDVRLGMHLNKKLWERGMKKPPHKVEVLATKIEEKGEAYVTAELPDAPKEEKKMPESKKKGKITDRLKEALKAPEDKEAKEEKAEKEKLLKQEQEHKAEETITPHKKYKAEAKKEHKKELFGHTGKKGGAETTGEH